MDAKQACDKLNGFNFQNRYLVGTSNQTGCRLWTVAANTGNSSISPAREDGQVERRPCRTTREPREIKETARNRLSAGAIGVTAVHVGRRWRLSSDQGRENRLGAMSSMPYEPGRAEFGI